MSQGRKESICIIIYITILATGTHTHQLRTSEDQCQTYASELFQLKGEGAGLFIHQDPFMIPGTVPNGMRMLMGR